MSFFDFLKPSTSAIFTKDELKTKLERMVELRKEYNILKEEVTPELKLLQKRGQVKLNKRHPRYRDDVIDIDIAINEFLETDLVTTLIIIDQMFCEYYYESEHLISNVL